MLNVSKFFPNHLASIILQNSLDGLEEIRIRIGKPIILKFSSSEIIIDYIPNQEEILRILQIICDNSIYSYQNQICQRFYYNSTADIEFGITGDVVLENRKSEEYFVHIQFEF